MSKKVQIDNVSKDCLHLTVSELIPTLADDKDLVHVRQSAFDYYNPETQETYQVHVMVIRDEKEFLGPFEIVQTTSLF